MMDQVASGTIYPAIYSSNNLHCLIKQSEQGEVAGFLLSYHTQSQRIDEWFYVNTNISERYPFHRAWFEQIEAKGGQVIEELQAAFEALYSLALKHNVPFLTLAIQSVQDATRFLEQQNSPQQPQV